MGEVARPLRGERIQRVSNLQPHPALRLALRAIVEQGITPALPDPLKKRIRLTNGLSLFGAFVMLASIPFDWSHAPRWMLAEDVGGALAFLVFPLLNRMRRLLASRILCLVLSNLIVLGNAALLGPESGAQLVFIALAAMPFAMFDLSDRIPLASCVVLSIACFAAVEVGLVRRTPGSVGRRLRRRLLPVFGDRDAGGPGLQPVHDQRGQRAGGAAAAA